MSRDRYVISDQHAIYFLTFTVVDWIDVFTRPDYKMIIVDSLNHCVQNKNLEIFGWVLMTNHMHLLARANVPFRLSDVIRDFKKFTSKKLVETIQQIPESRKEWLLHKFGYHAKSTHRAEEYKLWQDGSHAICLDNNFIPIAQKLDYIHNNPVRALIVAEPHEYIFSSASDYHGIKQGLVKISLIEL